MQTGENRGRESNTNWPDYADYRDLKDTVRGMLYLPHTRSTLRT